MEKTLARIVSTKLTLFNQYHAMMYGDTINTNPRRGGRETERKLVKWLLDSLDKGPVYQNIVVDPFPRIDPFEDYFSHYASRNAKFGNVKVDLLKIVA